MKAEAQPVDSIVVPQKSIESLSGMCISIPISRGALTEEEITGSLGVLIRRINTRGVII